MQLPIPSFKRIPILYLLLALLIVVGVVPLYIYSGVLVANNRERLKTGEKTIQSEVTSAIGDDVAQRYQNIRNLLQNTAASIEVTSGGSLDGDRVSQPALKSLLERFVSATDSIAYASVVNSSGKGITAGRIAGDAFLQRELEHAFTAAIDGRTYDGQPLSIGGGASPRVYFVVSQPIRSGDRFIGVLATVIDLQHLVDRLRDIAQQQKLQVFIVDQQGRLVASAGIDGVTGQDVSGNELVKTFVEHAGRSQVISTSAFTTTQNNRRVEMLGTYRAVPSLNWAVVAQKSRADAFRDVDEMQFWSELFVAALAILSLVFSFYFARRITTPIQTLAASSQAIARGDFSQRVQVKSRTEIGELAQTFNSMSSDLERFVHDLRRAAEENRTLFLSSIQMMAGAVDEKDPYTRGHSDRVTRYSVLLARELGEHAEMVERVRISAQLHDVGKIGIEDRILNKPGKLSPEEYEIMKMHTIKGANILRPVEMLRDMIPGLELHHEALDGSGYPYGLRGDEIPMLPRIITVADTFDAMTTNRPYQKGMDPDRAVELISSLASKKFDPRVVAALQLVFDRGDMGLRRTAPSARPAVVEPFEVARDQAIAEL